MMHTLTLIDVQAGNPISKLTASSLEDIDYIVDPDAVSEPGTTHVLLLG